MDSSKFTVMSSNWFKGGRILNLHEVCKFNLESQAVALLEVHQGPGEAAGGD